MKSGKTVVLISVVAACVAGVLCMSACTGEQGDTNDASRGEIAAMLGNQPIYENDVTAYIESLRDSWGCTGDDATWAMYLNYFGYTPEDLRTYIIDWFAYEDALEAVVVSEGVEVSEEDVDAAVESMKSAYSLTDAEWAAALASSGYTEESYRASIRSALAEDVLYDRVTSDEAVTDEVFDEFGMPYVEMFFGNMKRSSHILFALENSELAQTVLDQLLDGTITFRDAVAQYSIDDGSVANGGDLGWDRLTTFVTEYQTGLDALEAGQMSGLVESEYGYHIILCTDEFVWTEDTVAAQVPEEVRLYVINNYIKDALWDAYVEDFRDNLGYEVYAMPAGLSYDVDVEALLNADTEGEESDGSGDGRDGGEVSVEDTDTQKEAA